MRLDLPDVAGYLLARGLVGPRAVVDGGLRIVDVSRRNRVYLVRVDGERDLVLKLARRAGDGGVAREAAVLARLHAAGGGALAPWLPPVAGYDVERGVLVLEAAPDARALSRVHAGGRFPPRLAATAGRALARVHAQPAGVVAGLAGAVDPRAWLRVHRPRVADLRRLSAAAVDLVRIVQRDGVLCDALDALLADWSTEGVVHGDVRWANLLATGSRGLVLIDWEHAAAGDPALDVGAFLGDHLAAWLRSIPIVDATAPGLLAADARLPLRAMRPAIGAFWNAYARERGHGRANLSRTLRRAVRFAGVRLLAGAFEEAQTLASLRAPVVHRQRLGRSVLERPDEAAAQLLGLPAGWG